MSKPFFVTGTDTDAGKTLIATALLAKARQQGLQTLGLKPLAAGGEDLGGGLQNDDAVQLQKTATISLAYDRVNPILLQEPMAPHIAAVRDGKPLSVALLLQAYGAALSSQPGERQSDLCLVEGAGGWRVPLNQTETMADFVIATRLPVILVVGMKLGCLNHALLTAEAITRDGLTLAAWVASQTDPNMTVVEENLATLQQRIAAPCLGYVPWLSDVAPENVAQYLDLNPLELRRSM